MTLRLIVRRSPGGHQTPILTNRTDLSAAQVIHRMAARWRQEDYFKYAREHREFWIPGRRTAEAVYALGNEVLGWRQTLYFTDLIGVLRRRWGIFFVGFVLMGAASAGIMMYVPANYQASGNVLFLLPPKTGTVVINPYLNLQSGLSAAASIVGSVMMTTETQASVAQSGFTSTYAVSQAPGSGVPVLSVSAEDTDPQMAVKTVGEVNRRIGAQLTLMQELAEAPSNQLISISTFSVTQQAEVVRGAKLRALAVALAVVGVGTALVAFTVDASQRRKAARDAEKIEAAVAVKKAAAAGHGASRTRGRIRRRRRDKPMRAPRSLVKATSYEAPPQPPPAPRSRVTTADLPTAKPTREGSDSDLERAGRQRATRSE